MLKAVGRGSVRTGAAGVTGALRLTPTKQIENENDDEDEDDCSKLRARLKAVGRGSVRTGRRASPARYG
jgi:hypothetical protein